jgi:tetratricopeptide (TPR) repeat protein
MHDLLRLYAGTQPPETPDEATTAKARLFSYYQDNTRAANTHLVPTAAADTTRFATREQALTWLDAEHPNLIAVCTTAPSRQLPQTSTDLAFTLARFLHFRRYFDDLITITTTAADIYRQTGDRRGEGAALNNLGLALADVRRFDEAVDAHTQDLEICRQIGDRHGEGAAQNNLGVALRHVRRFDEAVDAHTQAAEIFRQPGDRHSKGQALNNLGVALRHVRRFDEAVDAHTQAAEILGQTGDRHGEGHALNNLGVALGQVRRFDEARSYRIKAIDAFTDAGDTVSATLVRLLLDEIPPSADYD